MVRKEMNMKRVALVICLLVSPLLLMSTSGCEEKVRTVDRKTTVQQSEPKMRSPGTEQLE
jgi:hypothetical protein